MAKRKHEDQEITGQQVTKYMFIAIGAIIAIGLLLAGGLNLYFMIAKSELNQPPAPIKQVETPVIETPPVVTEENVIIEQKVQQVNQTTNQTETNQTETSQPANQTITNQTATNQTITLEVTNTQNTTNTSSAVKYNFDQLSIKFPETLNYTRMGKMSYHYINITKPDNTPTLNSEGFEIKATIKPSQGMTSQLTPQYEKGQWLISFYPTSPGISTLTVTVGCKDTVNYCSRIFSGTPKTEQTQFIVS